ncbi:MAG: MEDS domain-containing protein [Alphaproteobacteria bacterium]|uniref:histidine kinase n=1 Tax=Candidatus Nitrobium versatile TaxID=2884831 RepID=A0A953JA00_9BACT|nr:MEDS domain-containing protein [Candidatus Nitrobium versatile]
MYTSDKETLSQSLDILAAHNHLCLIYTTREEQFSSVVPFIRAGLERGEKCLYVAEETTAPEILDALRRGGIDTEYALASGALTVTDKEHTYLGQGLSDPDRALRLLEDAVKATKAEGFSALRAAAEMSWVLGGEPGTERLMEYEAKINSFFPRHDVLALCQYNRLRFSPEIIRDVVYTHPWVIYGSKTLQNFHYIPPEEFLRPDPAQEMERLLGTLTRHKQMEETLTAEISRHRQTESALLESRKQLTMIFRETPALVTISTIDEGRFLMVNTIFERISGYSSEEAVGRTSLELGIFADPADRERILRLVEENDEIRALEVVFRTKRGELITGLLSSIRIEYEGNACLLSVVDDITAQKRAREEILSLKNFYESILENIYEGVWVTDRDDAVSYANKGMEINAGVPLRDLLGKNVLHGFPEETLRFFAPLYLETKRTLQPCSYGPIPVVTPGGRMSYQSGWLVPLLKDGAFGNMICTAADVTARVEAEKSLVRAKEEWERTFDTIPDMIMLLDTRHRIIRVNKAMASLLQTSPDEVSGLTCYKVCHRQKMPVEGCPHSRLLADGKEHTAEVFDPSTGRYFLVSVSPIIGTGGIILGSVHIARDITERKQAERQLEELNRTLEERVVEEVALNREKDHIMLLQSRQAAMGEMIGNIAHQWRQPLNAVGLIIQALLDAHEYGELDRQHLAGSVEQAMEIIRHMSQTIDDFRNFFKPDKEKHEFSLSGVIRKVVSFIEASFRNNTIRIELDLQEEVCVNGYPNEYSQVLLNILDNAKDAALERHIRDPLVRIRLRREGGRSVVTVGDTMGGIPASVMDRIFEPYFTTKEPGKGTGIGLYMSKNIIEKNMGGRLTARNRDNGAEFIIEV